jgi:beta-glucanase (GH16 family)
VAKLNGRPWDPGWFGSATTGPINSNEIACYDPANVALPGFSELDLSLTASSQSCGGEPRPYTGAVVSTNPDDGRSSGGFEFTYGLVQARVYVPAASGHIVNWPALMTLGQSWPEDGEDDILEGVDGTICVRFHSPQNALTGAGRCLPTVTGGWITVAVDWEPGSATWYYNGIEVASTTEVTDQPMYLAIVYTASDKAPELATPATLRVTYVRVWQHPAAMASGLDTSRY